uniref:3-oxoacyl-[acyl-carrier-protein reductase n=1 Tax=Ascaris suum TaxID=6253 RepID=F1L972_ASCSU
MVAHIYLLEAHTLSACWKMARFDGKVALVTGSSNGIGRATAILFAKDGAKVTITGRDIAALTETKTECMKAGAKEDDILMIAGDITNEEVRNELVDKTIAKFGKLNILVSNHGGSQFEFNQDGSWNMDAFDPILDQNTKSTLALCLKAYTHLKESKGDIVLVGSIVSMMAAGEVLFYALSKAAISHLTTMLGYRFAKDDVRVNCVNPGIVSTTFLQKLGVPPETSKKMEKFFASNSIPMGRAGVPKDIAEPIAFLADRNASGYITGQSIVADGGATLQHSMVTHTFAEVMKQVGN